MPAFQLRRSLPIGVFPCAFYVALLPYAVTHGLNASVAGVLGYQLLRNRPATIDYQNESLTLHDARSFRYNGNGIAVPLLLNQRQPMVQGAIDGIPGTFRIDTGSTVPLTLSLGLGRATKPLFLRHRQNRTILTSYRQR